MTAIATNDQIAEWLESHGATHTTETIYLVEIDDRRSLQNQARFQALDERLVITYTEAMTSNAKFPPIVVAKTSHGYLVIDGNHRVAAARLAGKTSLAAYVITDATERQIHVLTFDANTKHGMPTTADERKAHAVYLVDTAGVSQRDAATMLNIPLRELNAELTLNRINRRLAALGVERYEDIARSTRSRMDNVRNDKVLKALADLVIRARVGHQGVDDLVNDINKQPDEAAGLAVVAAGEEQRASEMRLTVGGRTKIPQPLMRLQRSLAYAESVAVDLLDPAALDAATKASLVNRITEVRGKLEAAAERLA